MRSKFNYRQLVMRAIISAGIIFGPGYSLSFAANKEGGGVFTTPKPKTVTPKKKVTAPRKKPTATKRKVTAKPKRKTNKTTGNFASAASAASCSRWSWRGNGNRNQTVKGKLKVKTSKACWIRFIGSTSSSSQFKGGSIKRSDPNVRFEKAGSNKIMVRPRIGYSGAANATVAINMSKAGNPYKIIINYKITVK